MKFIDFILNEVLKKNCNFTIIFKEYLKNFKKFALNAAVIMDGSNMNCQQGVESDMNKFTSSQQVAVSDMSGSSSTSQHQATIVNTLPVMGTLQSVLTTGINPTQLNTGIPTNVGVSTSAMNTIGMNSSNTSASGGINTSGMSTVGIPVGIGPGVTTIGLVSGVNTIGISTAGMNTIGMNSAVVMSSSMNTSGINTGVNTSGINAGVGVSSGINTIGMNTSSSAVTGTVNSVGINTASASINTNGLNAAVLNSAVNSAGIVNAIAMNNAMNNAGVNTSINSNTMNVAAGGTVVNAGVNTPIITAVNAAINSNVNAAVNAGVNTSISNNSTLNSTMNSAIMSNSSTNSTGVNTPNISAAAQTSSTSTSTGASSQEQPTQILTRMRLQDLVREVDPNEQLDEDVEDVLLQMADDFVESAITAACLLAKHRKSNTVEVKDLQLHLERNWNMWIPGFGTDELRPYKRSSVTEAHKQRMTLIRKTLKKY
ncbi:hypothetical protein O3M35_000064 [Rhynocoris fuscipes]|uniref:Transcription initiation factor TFIID subunit 12 n=1 Tax=Rhynocoris fuscipes TaxID=488301 RepID=A0AAW1DMF7_9HEMI